MNYFSRSTVILAALSMVGFCDSLSPETHRMEPRTGKPGTVLKITGKALDASHIAEVYLTDHRFDMKVKVLEQTADYILIRVPPFAKPGRLQLLFLTAGSTPVYLEQPLYLLVEAGSEDDIPVPTEISQKSKPIVEVASTGAQLPVPVKGAPPVSPAMSANLEKSVTPQKPAAVVAPAPVVAAVVQSPPPQVAAAPVAVASAAVPPRADPNASKQSEQAEHPAWIPLPAASPQPAPPPATTIPAPTPAAIAPQTSEGANIPARLVQRVAVRYPASAIAQRIEGKVELIAFVGADGRVRDVKVLKGSPYLTQAGISAVREWVYEPAYLRGKPVDSEVQIILNFTRPK